MSPPQVWPASEVATAAAHAAHLLLFHSDHTLGLGCFTAAAAAATACLHDESTAGLDCQLQGIIAAAAPCLECLP